MEAVPNITKELNYILWRGALDIALCTKFVSDLQKVARFLRVIWFITVIKLTDN